MSARGAEEEVPESGPGLWEAVGRRFFRPARPDLDEACARAAAHGLAVIADAERAAREWFAHYSRIADVKPLESIAWRVLPRIAAGWAPPPYVDRWLDLTIVQAQQAVLTRLGAEPTIWSAPRDLPPAYTDASDRVERCISEFWQYVPEDLVRDLQRGDGVVRRVGKALRATLWFEEASAAGAVVQPFYPWGKEKGAMLYRAFANPVAPLLDVCLAGYFFYELFNTGGDLVIVLCAPAARDSGLPARASRADRGAS